MKSQLLVILGLVAFSLAVQVWDNGFAVEHLVKNEFGPTFISGKLGVVAELSEEAVQRFISRKLSSLFQLNEKVKFVLERSETDVFGKLHYRFDQQINNINVQYAKLIIHINPTTHEVFAITSEIVPGFTLPSEASFNVELAKETLISLVPSNSYKIAGNVDLVYLLLSGKVNLAYKADILYNLNSVSEMRSYFYLDAIENTLIVELNRYINALERNVYSANNGRLLPGTLIRTEGSIPSTDTDVNEAYTNSGYCYDFYDKVFGRDSYDNNGAPLDSTVHYSNDYNNAFWNGEQMVYGDGDGVTFSNFAGDLTVVCHELTHAVVEYTANLVYQDEPGALNEGFADILGYSSYMYQYGELNSYPWMIGAECYTPGKPGDALRYMDNPPKDGSSYDFYPGYTGILDNGGVHWNSGIANLAYVLACQGGVHPQQKTTFYVTPIGVPDAQNIFYTVLANYLGPNSQFANARASSVTVAKDVSAQAIETADLCWAAVGVPSTSV